MSKLSIGGAVVMAFIIGMTAQSLNDWSRRADDREEIEKLRFQVVKWQCKWMTAAIELPDGEEAVKEFMGSQREIIVSPVTRKWLDDVMERNNNTKFSPEPKREDASKSR